MPIIQMNLLVGRTTEQKRRMVAAVTEAVTRTLDVKPEQVRILINEMDIEHFAVGGVTAGERESRSIK